MKTTRITPILAGLASLGLAGSLLAAQPDTTQKTLSESFETISKTLNDARRQVTQAVNERDQAKVQLEAIRKANAERDRQIEELRKQLKDAEQTQIYDQMEPYKLYNKEVRGKMVYAYKDPEQEVVYIGGPAEHEKYQKYAVEQRIAADQRMAAEMQMESAYRWNSWGPYRPWWY